MTLDQYKEYLLCFLCGYGKMVSKYNSKLRIGEWCDESEASLHFARLQLDLFKCLDVRELPDFPGTYDSWTEDQFLALTKNLKSILL